MRPKTSSCFSVGLFVFVIAALTGGCSSTKKFVPGFGYLPKDAPTYALAVAVHGGVEPTTAQWNAMYTRFSQALAARGMLLINDHAKAQHIIYLDFLPDPTSPTRGTAMITSIAANPAFGKSPEIASSIYTTTFASYTRSNYDPFWANTYGYDRYNYYGNYYDPYNSGYGYTTPSQPPTNTAPAPVTPPAHHRPPNPADCPPGSQPYRPPPSYVGHNPHPPSHAYRPLPASDNSSSSSARSSSSSSSTYDSSSRSSYSSSSDTSSSSASYSSSSSSSSSYSAPSYSAPAESSSYSSSANSGGSDTGSRSVPR